MHDKFAANTCTDNVFDDGPQWLVKTHMPGQAPDPCHLVLDTASWCVLGLCCLNRALFNTINDRCLASNSNSGVYADTAVVARSGKQRHGEQMGQQHQNQVMLHRLLTVPPAADARAAASLLIPQLLRVGHVCCKG